MLICVLINVKMKTFALFFSILISIVAFSQQKGNVSVGDKAIDFTLKTISGDEVTLTDINNKQPVVLVVLRGWPGYQCPICTRQVGGLVAAADNFSEHGAAVIMVYPGPSEQLQEHATEFAEDLNFPDNFYFLIDPDYSMIKKYGLRWEAAKETAYPSTFVINKEGKITFAKVSTTHGGRASNEEILDALGNLH